MIDGWDDPARQNLHDRTWALWDAATIEGILTKAERRTIIAELLDKQQADGGWSLASLGPLAQTALTTQETISDGCATSLVLTDGVPKDQRRIA